MAGSMARPVIPINECSNLCDEILLLNSSLVKFCELDCAVTISSALLKLSPGP